MTRHAIQRSEFSDCDQAAPRTQYGALCWRMHRDRVEVLLITSRDTRRWVIPKGWPMSGLPPEAAAAREAWEEAGVEGAVDDRCAGCYTYQKVLSETDAVPCAVAVYGLRVSRLAARFPERKERRRKWFSVAKAARKVWEPDLRSLMLAFDPPKARDQDRAMAEPDAMDATSMQPEASVQPEAAVQAQPDGIAGADTMPVPWPVPVGSDPLPETSDSPASKP